MYIAHNVATVVPRWFPTELFLLLSRKLPRCTKGENKSLLSLLIRPASLQICTNPPLPAGYVVKVQKWRSRAEVTNPVHFTASPHKPTIHLAREPVLDVVDNLWKLWFDHILTEVLISTVLLTASISEHFSSLCASLQLHRSLYTTQRSWCIYGKNPPCPIYLVKCASHEDSYTGHLSKFLNCVKPIFAMQTIMCSFVQFEGPEKPYPIFFYWEAHSVWETKSKVTFLLSSTICR